jgi:hypothetical protein
MLQKNATDKEVGIVAAKITPIFNALLHKYLDYHINHCIAVIIRKLASLLARLF